MQKKKTKTDFEALVAENRFINDLLVEIERILVDKEWSQADLARALDISEARVSQIMSGNGKNLQARTIARIAHYLGVRASISFTDEPACAASFDDLQTSVVETKTKKWLAIAKSMHALAWSGPSNDDDNEATEEFAKREREAA